MRKLLALCCTCATLAAPLPGQAAETATYDLLFRNGTLDAMPEGTVMLYERAVENRLKPEAASRDTGEVALSLETGEVPMAALDFRQDGKHRGLGSFPASVGNPIIMYFYETVVRDMAESAGGSPFYIRNRVKDALTRQWAETVGEAEFDGRTVATRTVTLRPFSEDPNRAQMGGFADLALSVTMSDEVPGWYLALVAEAPAPGGGAPVYRSEMRLEGPEGAL